MNSHSYHLAQVNIARMIAPLESPVMEEFVALLDGINALAEKSPGFVWRLQTDGDETSLNYLRPFDDDRIIVNLTLWESVEQLKEFVYKTTHAQVMQKRQEWFEKFRGINQALWWVKAGHIPTAAEALYHLDYLQQHGETAHTFTFKKVYLPAKNTEKDIYNHFP